MKVNKTSYFGMPAYQCGDNGKIFAFNPAVSGAKERAKADAKSLVDGINAEEKAVAKAEAKAEKKAKKK